jgi:hypothetical protein
MGFKGDNPDLYIAEEQAFNIIRKFKLEGKYFRLKARVKPGIKEGYLDG